MDLVTLRNLLADDDLIATFELADEEFDADRVDVSVEIEGFSDPLTLQIMQVETDQDSLPGAEMVQLYAPIPLELDEEAADTIIGLLPEVNQAVPLIGFNVHPEEGFVYFRHVMLTPLGETGQQLVKEAVWMAHFALDTFAYRFAAIARP